MLRGVGGAAAGFLPVENEWRAELDGRGRVWHGWANDLARAFARPSLATGAIWRMNDNDLQGMSQILRHRLRGIAAGIRGALGLIEEEGASQLPPGLREYFPLMIRECDALQEVANRMSLFFDPPPPAEPTPADVATLRVLGSLAERFPAADVRSRGNCEDRVSGWMELALAELVANACEAAPNGTATVRLRRDGGMVVWTVSDYGPGLDKARIADPFAPFQTTKPRHLGLGLPIARRLAELAGGRCGASVERSADAAWSVDLACPAIELDCSGGRG